MNETSARDPNEIERDINQTRDRVERTLDELRDKFSIRNRVHGAVDRARRGSNRFADLTARLLNDHRETAIAVAAVAVPLLLVIAARAVITRRGSRSWR